jgi:hypothetical protein
MAQVRRYAAEAALVGLVIVFGCTARGTAQDEGVPQQLVTSRMLEHTLDLPLGDITAKWDHDGVVPLSELLEVLFESMSESAAHDVKFAADTAELALDGISTLDDVMVHVPPYEAGTVRYRDVLEWALRETCDPELGYRVRSGQIMISTVTALESEPAFELRTYDVKGLIPVVSRETLIRELRENADSMIRSGQRQKNRSLNPRLLREGKAEPESRQLMRDGVERATDLLPSRFVIVDKNWFKQARATLESYANSTDQKQSTSRRMRALQKLPPMVLDKQALIDLIVDHTPELQWFPMFHDGGRITILGTRMFVSQNYAGQRHISRFLRDLRSVTAKTGPPVNDVASFRGFRGTWQVVMPFGPAP